jgi:hypothetical protein
MPLDVPVDEAITDDVVTLLEDELTDLEIIRQTNQVDEWTPKNDQVVIVRHALERLPEIDCPGNPPAIGYEMILHLRLHVMQSEHDTEPLDKLMSILAADVQAALTQDSGWYHWDGKAIDSEFGSFERISTDTGFAAALLPLRVRYRVSENNPYESRL